MVSLFLPFVCSYFVFGLANCSYALSWEERCSSRWIAVHRGMLRSAPRTGDQRRAGWRCAAAFGFQSKLELLRRSERRPFFIDDEPASAGIRHALAEQYPLALALGPGLIGLTARRGWQVGEREHGVRGSRPGSVVSARRGGGGWRRGPAPAPARTRAPPH